MNHPPPRGTAADTVPTTTEAQLKWALVTSRQRAQAARERIRQLYGDVVVVRDDGAAEAPSSSGASEHPLTNRLDDSQSEYSERKRWIEAHGYRHECSHHDDDNSQQGGDDHEARARRRRRMNESWGRWVRHPPPAPHAGHGPAASFLSPPGWRRTRTRNNKAAGQQQQLEEEEEEIDDDDPAGRAARFRMAFAAAVAAIERNKVEFPFFPPSRFDSTSTAATTSFYCYSTTTPKAGGNYASDDHGNENDAVTPQTRQQRSILLAWTPQLREQVASAAKSVLRPPRRREDLDDGIDDEENNNYNDESFVVEATAAAEQGQHPLENHHNAHMSSIVIRPDDEANTLNWTVNDSMSTIPPPGEEESVEEEAQGVGDDDASAIQEPSHANMNQEDTAAESEISGVHLPGRDLSLFEWTQLQQLLPRPDDSSPRSVRGPAAATTSARRRQEQVLEKILPDDEDRPVDWTSSLWSNIAPNPWWSPPPSRSTTATPVHDKKNHDQNYDIDSSAGCGLSVRRGTHGPPVVSSHHYCSAHWERQMML
jgi:hypothetical protein